MSSKKVAMVAWSTVDHYPPVTNLAIYLKKNGCDVTLHCLGHVKAQPQEWARQNDIEIVRHGEISTAWDLPWSLKRMAAAFAASINRYDLVVLHSFQSFGIFTLMKFAKLHCTVLYCAHEFYPMKDVTCFQRIPKRIEMKYAKHCVVSVPDPLRAPLHHLELSLLKTPYVVRNCPLKRKLSRDEKTVKGNGTFVIGYSGRISRMTGTDKILKALQLIESNINLRLIGPIEPSFDAEFRLLLHANKEKASYQGCVPYNKVPHFLKECDAGILYYDTTSLNTTYCAPAKLFEYISEGLPVIGPPLLGIRNVLFDKQLGWIFEKNEITEIAHAISAASQDRLTEFRKRCIEWHIREFNYESQFEPIAKYVGLL